MNHREFLEWGIKSIVVIDPLGPISHYQNDDQQINTIPVTEVAIIYAEGRTVYLITNANQKFIIDYKIEQLSDILDPSYFNRINRSSIIHIKAIKEIIIYSNSRLKIDPIVAIDKELIVSHEKVNDFKTWLEGDL